MNLTKRLGKPAKASAGKGVFNVTRIIIGTAIQALAADALDGWLSWALWALVAWNVAVLVLLVIGSMQLASEAVNRANERAARRLP